MQAIHIHISQPPLTHRECDAITLRHLTPLDRNLAESPSSRTRGSEMLFTRHRRHDKSDCEPARQSRGGRAYELKADDRQTHLEDAN